MILDDILAGISILRNHYAVPNWFHLEAEHDRLYMHATDFELLPANVERLLQLGWFQEGCETYEPEEDWICYV